MGTSVRRVVTKQSEDAEARSGRPMLRAFAMVAGAIVLAACIYGPALEGRFVFDDTSLPFNTASRDGALRAWMSGVRPLLMASYWVNYHIGGLQPYGYHLANLLIHCVNVALVFGVLLRLLGMAGWPRERAALASALGALTFAIHPLQTEAVSYIAGRSESLAAMFVLAAWLLFLRCRERPVSWWNAAGIALLFALGVKTKENAAVLAAILILTDLFWTDTFSLQGLRRNWRLWAVLAPGAAWAGVGVIRVLGESHTAGFSVASFRWYEYAFTEARAVFTYVRLAILPFGQSIDHDYPVSRTLADNGAFFFIAALFALAALAIVWRRRYPLACFGLAIYLLWLAPTSSVIPLDDALVERRMYLPLLGLILIGCEILGRVRLRPASAVCIAVLGAFALGKLSYDRNLLWANPDRLIEMAAEESVHNPRPMLNYAEALVQQGRCAAAPLYVARAEKLLGDNYYVHAAWGQALACLGNFDAAAQHLRAAARLQPCAQVYEWLGLVYGEMGLLDRSGEALKKSVDLDPASPSAHVSFAVWLEKTGQPSAAEQEYRRALSLDREDIWARTGLLRARAGFPNGRAVPARR